MRLDARSGAGHDWRIWECEQMTAPRLVVWVDDETAQYCKHPFPPRKVNGKWTVEIVQAKQIRILPGTKTILINPIPDEADVLTKVLDSMEQTGISGT